MRLSLAIALAASGCAMEALPAGSSLFGKCTFAEEETREIAAGDVFVYAVVSDGGELSVVTGTAEVDDALEDLVVRQAIGDLLPARAVDARRLEFGGLGEDREGVSEHSISMSDTSGAAFLSIGTTYGTELAYPTCAFRALP